MINNPCHLELTTGSISSLSRVHLHTERYRHGSRRHTEKYRHGSRRGLFCLKTFCHVVSRTKEARGISGEEMEYWEGGGNFVGRLGGGGPKFQNFQRKFFFLNFHKTCKNHGLG